MNTIYDSGWVPVASGTVSAAVRTEDMSVVRIIIAVSGSAGAGTTTAGWSAGGSTPVPWTKNTPAYPVTPLITGAFSAVAAPAASASNVYQLGGPSGTIPWLSSVVPQTVYVNTVAGAGSWARVIVEGS